MLAKEELFPKMLIKRKLFPPSDFAASKQLNLIHKNKQVLRLNQLLNPISCVNFSVTF